MFKRLYWRLTRKKFEYITMSNNLICCFTFTIYCKKENIGLASKVFQSKDPVYLDMLMDLQKDGYILEQDFLAAAAIFVTSEANYDREIFRTYMDEVYYKP